MKLKQIHKKTKLIRTIIIATPTIIVDTIIFFYLLPQHSGCPSVDLFVLYTQDFLFEFICKMFCVEE